MTAIPWNPHAYIVYHESYREGWQDANSLAKIAHVATPQWMLDGPSLFQVNDPVVLCGSCGGDATAKRAGYVKPGYHNSGEWYIERVAELPAGYTLCAQCRKRLEAEFLPYVTADDEVL